MRTFITIEELRAELVAFARRYNETWLVARHGYKTPARVREEQTTPRIAIDPTLRSHLTLGRLSKRSRVSQNRAALHGHRRPTSGRPPSVWRSGKKWRARPCGNIIASSLTRG